jgi:tetratricopeptide (TPR) repeat protein
VEDALTQLGFFHVVRVENLPARGDSSEHVCLGEVRAADALVLILHRRYGFVPQDGNPEGLSVTHIEYREARRMGIPVYAFISTVSDREPTLDEFISDVSDYSSGVFRRTWLSLDDLAREVRRSAVEWLSVDLRAGRMLEAVGLVDEERGSLAVDVSGVDVMSFDGPTWLATFLEQLDAACRARYLPAPVTSGRPSVDAYVVTVMRSSPESPLDVTLALVPMPDSVGRPDTVVVSIPLESPTPSTAAMAATALVEAAVHDASGAISNLTALAADSDSDTSGSAEALLSAAALVSAINAGVLSEQVVQAMLSLPRLSPGAISNGLLSLMAAQLRLEMAGAWRAIECVEQLSFDLLSTAIARGDATPDALYNLGRQALRRSRKLGLQLFEELMAADPSYEERWYFHRDLGLLEYGSGDYSSAAVHYDHACHLKDDDSELWRQAGDACYYDGQWAEALVRYLKALALDAIESYYVDHKVTNCRAQIAAGKADSSGFRRQLARSERVARTGDRLASRGHERLARPLFAVAQRICPVSFDAGRWLALYANRSGSYQVAIEHLGNALAAVPEDPFVRMNLAANLIFMASGTMDEDAVHNLKASFFHGGPQMLERFEVQMTNSDNGAELVRQASALLEQVTAERDSWLERRGEVHAPERYGSTTHIEIR